MTKPAPAHVVSLPDIATIEEALLAVPGVFGARIMLAEDASIGEIHVIASPRRAPKKVVRDIESFLVVRYAYRVDYRRISLVQLSDAATADRLTLQQVVEIQLPEGVFIEVELLNGEQRYSGRCAIENDPALAASKATIIALNALFAPRKPLTLVGVQSMSFDTRDVVTAYVMYQETTVEHVLGTTFVRGSVAEAAARSVLAAINRRFAGWISEQRHAPATALVSA